MTIYKVSELLDIVQRMSDEGYEYVEIDESDLFFEPDAAFDSLDFGVILTRDSAEGFAILKATEVPEDYQYKPR